MTRNELIEKVAIVLNEQEGCYFQPQDYHRGAAREVLSTIRAALQPSKAMLSAAEKEDRVTDFVTYSDYWRSMLAASALGEQSE